MSETEGGFTVVKNNKRTNLQKLELTIKNLQKKVNSPKVDLIQNDYFYKVRIELSGVKQETVKIEIKEEQIVLISGIRSTEFDKEDKVVYSETRYGNFMRRVKLPDLVNESFTHFYTDGVLYLTFKKKYDNNITFNESVNKSENWADII